jgi:hypothetical protein
VKPQLADKIDPRHAILGLAQGNHQAPLIPLLAVWAEAPWSPAR